MEQNYLAPHPAAVEQYRALLRAHGPTIQALGWPDEHRCIIRFHALTQQMGEGAEVLDFGCGLGHLYQYLAPRRALSAYVGVDVVPEFIERNRARAWEYISPRPPRVDFYPIAHAGEIVGTAQHIVACGVFTYRVYPTTAHELHVKQNLKALFANCTTALHVDFLSPDPDPEYRKPELFNMSIHTLINWMKEIGCRRWIIDRSYLPFEYCIHMFKDQEIQRPENRYLRAAP